MFRNLNSTKIPNREHPAQPLLPSPAALPVGLPWSIGYALTAFLILLLFLSFTPEYFHNNFQEAKDFLLSPHFPALSMIAILLCGKRVDALRYNLLVGATTAIYLGWLYGGFLSLFHMSGDSVCQVAYWRILWHPNLQGSIGVSFTKPGQVLYLGILSQLALWMGNWGGNYLFKAGMILAMVACVWSLVRIATDLGGRVAGLLAFLLTTWAFLNDFLMSESDIYFIAALFSGLRLYFSQPRHRSLGRLLLVAAIQFRIEAIAVLAAIWLRHAFHKEWRELRLFTAATLASLAIFVLVVFQIQGSLSRLNSGAAVGYVSPMADVGTNYGDRLAYIYRIAIEQFSAMPGVRFLTIIAIIGCVGAFAFGGRAYLSVFSSLIVIVLNVLFFGGTFNLGRYVAFIYAFACSVGAASLVLFFRAVPPGRWRPALMGIYGGLVVALLLTFDYSTLNTYRHLDPDEESGFLRSAVRMLDNPNLPAGSRLLSEDDLLSHLVVMEPGHYRKLTSLQLFNVSSESARKKILANSDYIWVELESYYYYYLFYLDDPAWNSDPFRMMIQRMLTSGKGENLYGFKFTPISRNDAGLTVKVE